MRKYVVRVPLGGSEVVAAYEGEPSNRWRVLTINGDLTEEIALEMLRLLGSLGTPTRGGFPEETRHPNGVFDAVGGEMVEVVPPFPYDPAAVY